jgi:hypothetical protein
MITLFYFFEIIKNIQKVFIKIYFNNRKQNLKDTGLLLC